MFLRALLVLVALTTQLISQDIAGFWKSIDPQTQRPECVLAIYPYQGKYYGRIIGSYNKEGEMVDTIYTPKDRAPGVQGNPYYSGLDFIWWLREDGNSEHYSGRIMDPRKGKVYASELWVENGNLIVRGKVLFFGQNRIWYPVQDSDLPKGFKKPDTATFVPIIPQSR
jgi:uncharacterized protein (DUF2147 family)